MPRVNEKLRRTWADARAQMLEERTHTQSGIPRSDDDIAIVDYEIARIDRLLELPLGTKFDARDVR